MEVIIAVQYSFTSVTKAAGKGLEDISIVFDSDHMVRTIPNAWREGVTVGRRE